MVALHVLLYFHGEMRNLLPRLLVRMKHGQSISQTIKEPTNVIYIVENTLIKAI